MSIGVYKARGFDTYIIEKECTDTKVIKGLGLCFKVFIEGGKYESIDERCFKQLTEMLTRQPNTRAYRAGALTAEFPLAAK